MSSLSKVITAQANRLLHRVGLHVTRHDAPGRVPWILRNLGNAPSPLRWMAPDIIQRHDLKTFVQVGANDGESDDPFQTCIGDFNITGVLVEPQPRASALLKEKYKSLDRVVVDQVAISDKEGTLTLYHFGGAQIATGVGKSINSDLLTSGDLKHIQKMEADVGRVGGLQELKVPALTWKGLLQKHNMKSPDMVVVDTEGMDDLIVNQIELGENGPAFIQFESIHLDPDRLDACSSRLANDGYRFLMSEYDLLCLHPRIYNQ